jgi:hypothetical protein
MPFHAKPGNNPGQGKKYKETGYQKKNSKHQILVLFSSLEKRKDHGIKPDIFLSTSIYTTIKKKDHKSFVEQNEGYRRAD